jgi:hypothetical protein
MAAPGTSPKSPVRRRRPTASCGSRASTFATDAPERFLRLACLNFATDAPERRARAAALLAAGPALPATSLAVAAACADVEAVRRHLAADPAAAARRADPYGWSPLMYQAHARHDPSIGRAATLSTARLLLDAGAEVNDGRFFGGLPTPFTVLTGLFAGNTRERPIYRFRRRTPAPGLPVVGDCGIRAVAGRRWPASGGRVVGWCVE